MAQVSLEIPQVTLPPPRSIRHIRLSIHVPRFNTQHALQIVQPPLEADL